MLTVSPPAIKRALALDLEEEEQRGISRIVAQIHWLLVSLVLIYLVFGEKIANGTVHGALTAGLFFYVAFVMVAIRVFPRARAAGRSR